MFVRRTVHADTEGSALDRKVRIFYMELKYLTHWHIPSICAERCTRDKEVIIYFSFFLGIMGYKAFVYTEIMPVELLESAFKLLTTV